MMVLKRFGKILASQSIGSRREVGLMIRKGRAAMNGAVVVRPEHKVDEEQDVIVVEGRGLVVSRFIYPVMNKPKGVLSVSRSTRTKTVVDLVPQEWQCWGLFPAGWLDKDAKGLLTLINDGDYAHKMLLPKKKVKKTHDVVLDLPIDSQDILAFSVGVKMKDFETLPARLSVLPSEPVDEKITPLQRQVRVCIHEGKFYQVKQMFMVRGKVVLVLCCVQIGSLKLDPNLSPGETRQTTAKEVLAVFT